MTEILVYTPQLTPRIKYSCEYVLQNLLGARLYFTQNKAELANFQGITMSYDQEAVGNEMLIAKHGLLDESDLRPQAIEVFDFAESKAFFAVKSSQAALPFDIFAASFYLLSRYEEQLAHNADTYGRFQAKDSLAYQNNFLQQPIINLWAVELLKIIHKKYPEAVFRQQEYQCTPTIDVDAAFAYKHKPFAVQIGGLTKAVISLRWKEFAERLAILFGVKKDPYQVFDQLLDFCREQSYNMLFFIHCARYGGVDKAISLKNKKWRSLVEKIDSQEDIGVHLSGKSNEKTELATVEINKLSEVLNRPITKNRQHFIMMKLPETYRRLIQLGITDDYSMGYAMESGFRAGTCTPFYFFDLLRNEATSLKIHPFSVMDATLMKYKKMTADEALTEAKTLADQVKKLKGEFVFIAHNDSISNYGAWKGWGSWFQQLTTYAWK